MAVYYSSKGGIPFGTTTGASRPAAPQIGQPYYNGTLIQLEIYTVNGWAVLGAAPAQVTSPTVTDLGSGVVYGTTAGSQRIAFTVPQYVGIGTAYYVTTTPTTSTFTGAGSPITVTGLNPGTTYTYNVYGTNSYGTGTVNSTASGTPTTAPQQPQSPLASAAGTTTAIVTFNGWPGGLTTTYTATSSPSSLTGTVAYGVGTTSGAISVTGLTSGSSYTFTVVGVNASGTSPTSAATASITLPIAATLGYLMGGANSNQATNATVTTRIYKNTLSTDTITTLSATVPSSKWLGIALSNRASTGAGYSFAGYNGITISSSAIKLSYSGETTSTLSATYGGSGQVQYNHAGFNASIYSYMAGLSVNQRLTYSSDTLTSVTAQSTLTPGIFGNSASAGYAWPATGVTPAGVKFTFATETWAATTNAPVSITQGTGGVQGTTTLTALYMPNYGAINGNGAGIGMGILTFSSDTWSVGATTTTNGGTVTPSYSSDGVSGNYSTAGLFWGAGDAGTALGGGTNKIMKYTYSGNTSGTTAATLDSNWNGVAGVSNGWY